MRKKYVEDKENLIQIEKRDGGKTIPLECRKPLIFFWCSVFLR